MQKVLFWTFVLFHFTSYAQSKNVYKSEADELSTIRTISILPIFDNMRGIYSRPVESFINEKLSKGHRFDLVEGNVSGPILTPDELEDNSATLQTLAQGLSADAFLATSIVKGPGGISIKMDLFLKRDQKLFLQESVSGMQVFDVDAVKKKSEELFSRMLNRVPYSGRVISRQGTRVTVNLGKQDGVERDQVLTVVQLIKLNRHPKFNFLVSTEKEVIGKIKLLKVDDTLSFARIVTEKESGAIQVDAKVAGLESVTYANSDSLSDDENSAESLPEQPGGAITFGNNPSAWLPKRNPTFGMVGARIGLGQYAENVKSTSSLDAKSPFYPSIAVDGEVWLTPAWSLHAQMRQGIISTSNPQSGSPSDLSHSLSAYEFLVGYNIRLSSEIQAPKVEALFGYSTYRLYVDESTPPGLTTKTYSGIKLGVAGSYPLGGASPYSLGANLNFIFNAKMKESPSTSGSADNTVNNFGFFVDKALSINLKARLALDFELYASDFSGSSPSSASQKHTTLSGGLYYLF